MLPESLHVPALIASILVLVSLIIIPVIVLTDWKDTLPSYAAVPPDARETTSCALPLTLNISNDSEAVSPGARPVLDSVSEAAGRALETATFALG